MILIRKLNKTIGVILVGSVIFLVIGMYAFPLWTGKVIQPRKSILPSNRYLIPRYYYEAGDWIATLKEDFRINPLPYTLLGYGVYNWEPAGFVGSNPTTSIFHGSLIEGLSGRGIGEFVNRLIIDSSTNKVSRLLALKSARYILFHKDTNWEYIKDHNWWISTSPEHYKHILNNQEGIHLERSFGQLDFYKISDEYFLPHIYVSTFQEQD